MRPPEPSQPVLFRTSRQLGVYRYVLPLAFLLPVIVLAWTRQDYELDGVVPYLLPVAVFIGGLLLHGRNLRAATITEPGIVVNERGADYLVEWTDIDWATELWMNPPTLVVRLKPGVPSLPPWFLLLPPREYRFGWRPQPMSQFVAEKTRESRATRPEHALEYGPWPSRAVLTLRVTGAFILLFLGALFLASWLHMRQLREAPLDERDGTPLHVNAKGIASSGPEGFLGPSFARDLGRPSSQ